jgi:hypothetical protein
MSTNTSRLALLKPDGSETVNVGTQVNANFDVIDLNMNFRVCTSSTRPSSPYTGQSIFETDTGNSYVRSATGTWVQLLNSSGSQLLLNNTNNATLSSTGHAVQIGPTSGINLIMDNDSLVARNNGAASALTLNGTGGNVTIGATGSTVTIPGTLKAGGFWAPVYVNKTSSTTRASTTTFADDPDLTMTLEANATYIVEMFLSLGGIDAAKIKTAWTVPSGATGNRAVDGPGSTANQSNTDNVSGRYGVHNFTTSVTYGTRNDNTLFFKVTETATVTTTNAGTLALQWAQATSSGTSSVCALGSWMRVTRIL